MNIEQRKYLRFSVRNDTFAALRSGFEIVGKINDISIKGLSLSYFVESINAGSERTISQVDIFLTENGFYLPELPSKIMYDIQDPKYNKYNIIMKRRIGLNFEKLNKSQSDQLKLFIKDHTIEPLSP